MSETNHASAEPPVTHAESPPEAIALAAIQRHLALEGWSAAISEVVLPGGGWRLQRHPTTGAVVARSLTVLALARWQNDECAFKEFELVQPVPSPGSQ